MAHKSEHVSTKYGFSVLNDGVKTEVIAQDGTIKGDIKEALAQGSIYIGNSSGVTSELSVKTDGGVLVGNGTTAEVKTLSGDITMNNAGFVTVTGASGDFTGSGRGIFNTAPAGYTTPTLGVGVYGTPVVDTALIDNIAFTSNMSTATNKTADDTSCMAAFFGMRNTADTAHNKLQGVLASTLVAGNCFDAYGVQGHVAVTADSIAVAGGTNAGNITGLSAKATVNEGITATGSVSGLLVTVDGAGTVTGTHQGIWLDTTTVVLDQAILVSGAAYTNLLKLSAGTAVVSTGTEASGNGIKITIDVDGTPYYINAHPTSNN